MGFYNKSYIPYRYILCIFVVIVGVVVVFVFVFVLVLTVFFLFFAIFVGPSMLSMLSLLLSLLLSTPSSSSPGNLFDLDIPQGMCKRIAQTDTHTHTLHLVDSTGKILTHSSIIFLWLFKHTHTFSHFKIDSHFPIVVKYQVNLFHLVCKQKIDRIACFIKAAPNSTHNLCFFWEFLVKTWYFAMFSWKSTLFPC